MKLGRVLATCAVGSAAITALAAVGSKIRGPDPHRVAAPSAEMTHAYMPSLADAGARVPHFRTAAEERAYYEQRLLASGEAPEPWHREGTSVLNALQQFIAKQQIAAKFSEVQCYLEGCESKVLYSDMNALSMARDAAFRCAQFRAYSGTKFHSGPERNSNGSINAVWIVFPPNMPHERKAP